MRLPPLYSLFGQLVSGREHRRGDRLDRYPLGCSKEKVLIESVTIAELD